MICNLMQVKKYIGWKHWGDIKLLEIIECFFSRFVSVINMESNFRFKIRLAKVFDLELVNDFWWNLIKEQENYSLIANLLPV